MTDEYDAETYDVVPRLSPAAPVDPPDEHRTLYANVVPAGRAAPPAADRARRAAQPRTSGARSCGTSPGPPGTTPAFHATRTPKYLLKVALWSPVGAFRWTVASCGLDVRF